MFRLTREVRFAIDPTERGPAAAKPINNYAGDSSLTGLGHYFALRVTVEGSPDPTSRYLMNIKDIDAAVRERAVPLMTRLMVTTRVRGGAQLAGLLLESLKPSWPARAPIHAVELCCNPFVSYTALAKELPMVRLSQKFEFSATHRLHNVDLSEEENRRVFGKCSNPHGHGHNYEVQVTLVGEPDENGVLIEIPSFAKTVMAAAIDPLDHRNLNVEIAEFRQVIPTVENIAREIHRRLKAAFADGRARLASVTVWETPKTWAEYAE